MDGWIGLAVALGCGLLVGIERERRKGAGPTRRAAGLRTFAVVALVGALSATSGQPFAVAAALFGTGALAALAYWRSDKRDPGMTTEVALVATCMIGVLAVDRPALAAASGTALALLLALRERLHRAATRLLSNEELHDGLLLAAVVLIALPLVPAEPIGGLGWFEALGGLKLRPFAVLVVLILGMQAASHVVLRLVGARAGWPWVGLLAGFVSSSAAVLTLGRQVRRAGRGRGSLLLACAAACSGVATWIQMPVIAFALAPGPASGLLLPAAVGALTTGAVALLWWRRSPTRRGSSLEAWSGSRRVLRVPEALGLALLLSGVVAIVALAQAKAGAAGLVVATLLGALADVHAAVAALAALAGASAIGPAELARGVLLAMGVNVVSRTVLAIVSGGAGFAARVGAALAAGLAAAGLAAWISGALAQGM